MPRLLHLVTMFFLLFPAFHEFVPRIFAAERSGEVEQLDYFLIGMIAQCAPLLHGSLVHGGFREGNQLLDSFGNVFELLFVHWVWLRLVWSVRGISSDLSLFHNSSGAGKSSYPAYMT